MSDKHGPNSWDAYLAVHEHRIGDFRDHFILEERLKYTITQTIVAWTGELVCADGIEIHVQKTQHVSIRDGRRWVQTRDYSYQVIRRTGLEVVQLFRYDNAAHHAHPDRHHRHAYDSAGQEVLPVEHIGVDRWPTLGDVIEEAFDHWNRGKP